MNRQNTCIISLNSGCEIFRITNNSLAIILDKTLGMYLNFPSEPAALEIRKNKVVNFSYDRMNDRLVSDYITLYLNTSRLVDLELRYGPISFIAFANNTSVEDQKLLKDYVDQILEQLYMNLLNRKCIEKITSQKVIIPGVSGPTWKDRLKIFFHNLLSSDKIQLEEARESKVLFYVDMDNINLYIRLRHILDRLSRKIPKEDLDRIHSMNAFIVIKVMDIYNTIENEAQIVIDSEIFN